MQNDSANQLYNALARLSRQIHRMEHWMANSDLSGGQKLQRWQTRLLFLISQNNGSSQRELAEAMDVRPSSMTEMVLKMEHAGLITRKQDEKDQRVMRIFLTETGEKAAAQFSAATIDLTSTMFNCLTPEEQSQMLALVEKISAGMESIVGSYAQDLNHHEMHKPHGRHGRHGQHRQHGQDGQHFRHHSPFQAEAHKPHRRF